MFDKALPSRPSLEQYKKQAKELVQAYAANEEQARARMKRHHPRLQQTMPEQIALSDAQFVLAREHGFLSWPKFQAYVTTLELVNAVAKIDDPAMAFLEVAVLPRHADHTSSTLEHAQMILARYPEVATANIYTAAVLGEEESVRQWLAQDASLANATGGPHGWDALTHLCFSRFLQQDATRADAFERTAKLLLDAGAKASTGWWETIDWPADRRIFESAIYAAAAVARHPGITQLLLDHGADPNADEETAYHVPESYDNTIVKLMLDSGKLAAKGKATFLVRKADWHDEDGMRMTLEAGGDPNFATMWGNTPLHHALERDNRASTIALLLQYGADPMLIRPRDKLNAVQIAAFRGRGDALRLFGEAAVATLTGILALAAAAALGDCARAKELAASVPQELALLGPTLLARAAGNGNAKGVRCLLEAGVPIDVSHPGDAFFGVWQGTTALHNAAWRARPECVRTLLAAGADPNVRDAYERTPLQLAVKATVDSYWKDRRTPESIEALLQAGATTEGIALPTGYDEADRLLAAAGLRSGGDSR